MASVSCNWSARTRILLGSVLFLLASVPALAQEEARQLVSVLDYLGGDYKNAVQNEKIINPDEYGEMQEFAKRSLELLARLKQKDKAEKAGIESDLKALASHVDAKADGEIIAGLTETIKSKLVRVYGIATHPKALPVLASGRQLYRENCAQCHGETGKGDGPGRESMNPKTPPPADFTDPERVAGLFPFKAYNTVTFGVEGTAMASFAAFSEEQRWQVAFYVMSLRHSAEAAAAGAKLFASRKVPAELATVALLATASDGELLAKLKPYAHDDGELDQLLAYLRRGLLGARAFDPLAYAAALMQQSVELYEKGDGAGAYEKAVQGYLDGYELAEPGLFARSPGFARGLEAQFTKFRAALKREAPVEEIRKLHQDITARLAEATEMSTRDASESSYFLFVNSALILLREGVEAALVLAAILAMLRVTGAHDAVRYVHFGWIGALLAGGATWILAQSVFTLSGQTRESMEGFVTILAAIMLFYIGYWLHTKSESQRWQDYIRHKVAGAADTRNILPFVGVSFIAVYREAFEVVLFYEALWLQSADNPLPMIWGFFVGAAAVVVAAFAIFRLGLRIPLRYFFGATGALLYSLSFVFAGKGITELQTAGWLSVTPMNYPPQVPLLGIYPTLESATAQGIIVLAFVATLCWMRRLK